MRPIRTWSSGGSSGAGGTWRTHLTHVARLALLSGRSWQTLQPHGARRPRETSRTFVAFLPKEALLAPRSRLAVGSGGAWLSDGALGSCRPWGTLFAFVSLAPLLSRLPNLSLVSVFTRGAHRASGTGEPHGTLQTVSASWALWTFLARRAFLPSRPGGPLGARSPWNSDGPGSTGWASLPWRSRRAWWAGGAFTAFQSKRPHWTRKSSVSREASQPGGTIFPRKAGRARVTLCPFFPGQAREPLFTGGARGPRVATLAHGTSFPGGTLRADHTGRAWRAGLALETRLASLSGVSREPVLAWGPRGALWSREPRGSLGSVGSPFTWRTGRAIASRVALGARLPGDAPWASFTPWARRASLPPWSRLPRGAPAALFSVGARKSRKSDGTLWPLSSWVAWQSWDSEFALLPRGSQRTRVAVRTTSPLGAFRTVLPSGTRWADLSPIALDAHVSFEAREAVFTLLTLGALQASDAVCPLDSARTRVADWTLGAGRTLPPLLSWRAFFARVPRGSVSTGHSWEAGFAQGTLFSWRPDCTLGAWKTLGTWVALLPRGARLSLGTHVAFRAWLTVHPRHTRRSRRAWGPLRPQQTSRPRLPGQPSGPNLSIVALWGKKGRG